MKTITIIGYKFNKIANVQEILAIEELHDEIDPETYDYHEFKKNWRHTGINVWETDEFYFIGKEIIGNNSQEEEDMIVVNDFSQMIKETAEIFSLLNLANVLVSPPKCITFTILDHVD